MNEDRSTTKKGYWFWLRQKGGSLYFGLPRYISLFYYPIFVSLPAGDVVGMVLSIPLMALAEYGIFKIVAWKENQISKNIKDEK